ncbi:MAG: CoA pyrophosphatase, partial [Halioglobus sp.]|nr:CoA pyrophosphatase [Halioglobus sp.]
MIETRLDEHSPVKKLLRRFKKRSAVAMVLSVQGGELHILMIKRAEREGDPWSGHMAFPGGRMDPGDTHAFAAALRETEEEVGLQLVAEEEYLGRLSDLSARPRFRTLGM